MQLRIVLINIENSYTLPTNYTHTCNKMVLVRPILHQILTTVSHNYNEAGEKYNVFIHPTPPHPTLLFFNILFFQNFSQLITKSLPIAPQPL